jgi:hypothetical protein
VRVDRYVGDGGAGSGRRLTQVAQLDVDNTVDIGDIFLVAQ